MLGALVTDVLVHTWDLSVATGVATTFDEDLVADAWVSLRDVELDRTNGMFGPAVNPPDDADDLTLLLAHVGRRPAPPAG